MRENFTPDMKWYYKLHGIRLERGFLIIPKRLMQHAKVEADGVYIYNDCELLDGNLCRGHPDKKPMVCRGLNEENVPANARISSNCRFNPCNKGVIP